tara:strand:+ start:434 stop:970 length:537 start_codon:yes stop_codon:yes gene_type:complete
MKDLILKLRENGKSYREIEKILGCSKGTISYHCGKGQKKKTTARRAKWREENGINVKILAFKNRATAEEKKRKSYKNRVEKFQYTSGEDLKYNSADVIPILEADPTCYLTGRKIDLDDLNSWQLDHIVPTSKGGSGSLKNMGLSLREANQSKRDMILEDYLLLCKEVLEHNGYTILKK